MWVVVQVPVSVCLFQEDRGQGCSSSPLHLDIKAILPSNSLSMVNWMEEFCALRHQWKVSRSSPCGQMAKTSPTYLSHILGLQGGISRSSMKMFTTVDESGESIAATAAQRRFTKLDLRYSSTNGKVLVWGCLAIPRVSRSAVVDWRWPRGLHPLEHWWTSSPLQSWPWCLSLQGMSGGFATRRLWSSLHVRDLTSQWWKDTRQFFTQYVGWWLCGCYDRCEGDSFFMNFCQTIDLWWGWRTGGWGDLYYSLSVCIL